MALPACEAVIEHMPAATIVAVLLDTVHTANVFEAKVTGLPEAPPVAVSATVPLGLNVWSAGLVKVMVCEALPMANDCVTVGAAA